MNALFTKREIKSLLADVQFLMNQGHECISALSILSGDSMCTHSMELIGLAHVALCTRDRRHLIQGIRCLIKADTRDRLPDLYSIAIRFGDMWSVLELHSQYAEEGFDMKTWICEYALPRFDCYEGQVPGMFFILKQDATFLSDLLAQHGLTWEIAIAEARKTVKGIPEYRYALLEKIARGEEPTIQVSESTLSRAVRVREQFFEFASQNGIRIIRQIQSDHSQVFLAVDSDGIVKVFKECPNESEFDSYGSIEDSEQSLNESLMGISGIADYYGVLDVGNGTSFLRFGVAFGSSLTNYLSSHATGSVLMRDMQATVGRLADSLGGAHDRGIAHLDIRPENVIVDGRDVRLLDFGDSRRIASATGLASTHVQDTRYVSPEVVLLAKGGCFSDIFQLGVLLHQLLISAHPFAEGLFDGIDREEAQDLGYALANALLPYEGDWKDRTDERIAFMLRMLSKQPEERPTAKDVANFFQERKDYFIVSPKRNESLPDQGTVIVPARMSVPHRGHIDYLSRLLDLGYSLIVSLQYSYFHDEDNPLPKWLVLKMIAKSLQKRGHDLERVRFMCTPMFMTDQRHRIHFSMMPERDTVVAIASGNPEVPRLLPGLPLIDQRMLFGREGEEYDVRSWGKILREAIRNRNNVVFRDLIAEGAEEILSLEEMRGYCFHPPVPLFVWDNALVHVKLHRAGHEYRAQRVSAYETPEDTVARILGVVKWIDRFSRDSLLQHEGHVYRLSYDRVELDASNNQCIHYTLA